MTMNVHADPGFTGGHPASQWSFRIQMNSQADLWITECFDNITITRRDQQTHIAGAVEDIAAVYGLITGLRDMGTVINYLEIRKEF